MKADLHVHSNASDGELPPEQLVEAAASASLSVIALTDHDTVSGVAGAREIGARLDISVIAACEFSVAVSWGEMHLLGYYLPVDNAELESFLNVQRDNRSDRARETVARLRAAGANIDFESVEDQAGGGSIGRPHVARALVDSGNVNSVDEAFRRYLGYGRIAFVPKLLPATEEVTDLVKRLGGVTSAAHLKDRGTKKNLRHLKNLGVDAVEVLHPSHDDGIRIRLDQLAADLGLLRTGGSDWHGPRSAYEGGALGDVDVPQAWLREIEAVHERRLA